MNEHPMKRARTTAGLTYAQVAVSVNRDTMTVRRWERGHSHPSYDTLLILSCLYGVPVADLTA